METCARCGASLPLGVRFCPSCGAPVTGGVPASERKLVTVLFADLIGSTTIAEHLDPESFKEIMDAYFGAMRAELEAEGGTVEKFIGDAVMAVFGVPAAHEDDPARALRAAMRMRHALEELNGRLEKSHGVTLDLRMGVNTGEVIAVTAARPGEALVAGDTVNVAARLEETAQPGQILVSERTARASAGARTREIGPLTLKGKVQRVRALELLDVDAVPVRDVSRRAAMVGRDREMALLRSLYERVTADGRPHLVTVYGDPGVGKSRLVEEFESWAAGLDPPPALLAGRCLPYGEGVTYWPLSEILKGHAGVLDTDPSDVAVAKIEEAAGDVLTIDLTPDPARAVAALCLTVGLTPADSPLGELEPRHLHREIAEAWRSFFSAVARAGPTLVAVEDLHWADPAMLELLEDLVDRAHGPLVFLCLARPDLATRRPEWGGGRRNGSSFLLQPLPAGDAERLLDLLAASEALPHRLRARILQRAGGNPLFLEEIIRHFLVDRDMAGDEALMGDELFEIPDTVQGLLAARMDLLDASDKRALQSAAVVGRVFWRSPVGLLLNGDGERLEESLDRLQERGLVHSQLTSSMQGEGEYAFNHILTRDVAYESLPRRERGPAHARIAAWLEERAGERTGEFAELLAYHYAEAYRGAQPDPGAAEHASEALRQSAFRFALLASEQARSKLALDVAVRFGESALSQASGPDERSRALEDLGTALYLNSQGDRAWEHLKEALDLRVSSTPLDHHEIARLAGRALEIPTRAPGTMRTRLSTSEIEPYLHLGLAHAGEEDSEELARLLIARSFLPVTPRETDLPEEEWKAAREAGERAVQMALRLDRPDLASAALDGLAIPFADDDLWASAYGVVHRRLELVDSLSDAWELADIYASAAQASLFIGRYREAESFADQGVRAAGSEAPLHALYCLDWRAWARCSLGEWDAALADVAQVRDGLGDRRDRPPALAGDTVAVAAFISETRGNRARADDELRLLSWLGEAEERPGAGWAAFRSLILARRGAFAESHAVLDAARDGERHYGQGLLFQARCAVVEEEQNWDLAPRLLAESRSHAMTAGLRALPLHASRLEGAMALAAGDNALARTSLETASRGFHGLEAAWEASRTDLFLARALHRSGDDDAARERVAGAGLVFERLGSVAEIRRAQELGTSL